MFGHRVKIEKELFERVKKCAKLAGYASPDELVTHVLEKEIDRILGAGGMDPESEDHLRKRLEGLGYIE